MKSNVKSYTKNGLICLLATHVLLLPLLVSIYLFITYFFQIRIEEMLSSAGTEKFWNYFLIFAISTFIFSLAIFILFVIGNIYLVVGRKEFGKRHEKFVKYGLVFLMLSIILNFSTGFLVGSVKTGIDTVSSFFGFLVSLCFLYNLENKVGKIALYSVLIINVCFSFLPILFSPSSLIKILLSSLIIPVIIFILLFSLSLIAYVIPILRINKGELIVETVCLPEPFPEQKQ